MGESRGADRKGREGHPPSSAGQSRTMRAERVRKTDRGAHREAQAEPHKEATPCKETAGVGGGARSLWEMLVLLDTVCSAKSNNNC